MIFFSSLRSFAVRVYNTIRYDYDTVDITNAVGNSGRRIGKVKAWGCAGTRYVTGDAVPHLRGRSTYSVPTTDGWHVNCAKGVIASWSDKPAMSSVADLYGRLNPPVVFR